MPYINAEKREAIHKGFVAENAGELNYLITMIVDEYLQESNESYKKYNEVIGVLECAKLELYRRMVVPHEERKLMENGDVYTERAAG